MTTTRYFMPQRPYSLLDAVNRARLATGSVETAMRYTSAGGSLDYNGHRVHVDRGIGPGWRAHYTWAGIVWLTRGASFEDALAVALREFHRGALGASIWADVETPEQAAVCEAAGLKRWSHEAEDAENARWRSSLYDEVHWAIDLERHGIPAVSLLLGAASAEAFVKAIREYHAERAADAAGVPYVETVGVSTIRRLGRGNWEAFEALLPDVANDVFDRVTDAWGDDRGTALLVAAHVRTEALAVALCRALGYELSRKSLQEA